MIILNNILINEIFLKKVSYFRINSSILNKSAKNDLFEYFYTTY